MKRVFTAIACFVAYMIFAVSLAGAKDEVEMTIIHPGEVNITKYTTVAMGNISGNLGDKLGDLLRARLVEAGFVKVIDRKRLETILKEQGISQSELMDEASRLKLGKILSASALINGHYSGDYSEEVTHSDSKDKKGNNQRTYKRQGKYVTEGNIEITDMETGQILKSINLQNSSGSGKKGLFGAILDGSDDTEYGTNDEPPKQIDQSKLMDKCVSKDFVTLFKALSPWQEKVKVPFEDDGKLPGLEKGIAMVKMGNMDMAITEFSKMVKAGTGSSNVKGNVLAKAHWDLGLVYMYTWNFDKAAECFATAYTLDSDKKYIKANETLKRLQEERKVLIEQGIVKEAK